MRSVKTSSSEEQRSTCAGRNPDKIANAAARLSEYKDRIRTVVVDVTKQEQVQKAIERHCRRGRQA